MAVPIALQLYTLRDACAKDFAGVVERVGRIGFAGIELAGLHGLPPPDMRSIVEDNGIRVASTHVQERLDGGDADRIADEAAATGAEFMVVPYLPPDRFTSADSVRRLAERVSVGVEVAESRGMKLAYHNHNFEFVDVDGRPAYELFVETLDPRVVLEVDIYWAQTGGADPASLVRALGPRVRLLHVKDGPCTEADPMVAVGDGSVDVPAALIAAEATEWHIVELDRYAGDMWDAVERSYSYLTGNGLSAGRR